MAKYSAGTVGLTVGSDLIWGRDTQFLSHVQPGDTLSVWGYQTPLKIVAVLSDIQLRVATPIAGAAGQGAAMLAYAINDDFSPILGLPLPRPDSVSAQEQMKRALEILDVEIPTTLNPEP